MSKRNRDFNLCHEAERQLSRERREASRAVTPFKGDDVAVLLGAIIVIGAGIALVDFAQMVGSAGPQIG